MATIIEDYTPIYVGDTGAKLAPTFQHADGTPVPLVGMTISLRMADQYGNAKNGAGVWTIDNASAGQAHYAYASNDVKTAGIWTLYIALTDGSGNPVHAYERLLEIRALP